MPVKYFQALQIKLSQMGEVTEKKLLCAVGEVDLQLRSYTKYFGGLFL